MSKFGKIALLTLAAFLLLVFSITANAGKPDSEQHIVSGPLWGNHWSCPVANMTDHDIEAVLHWVHPDGYDETIELFIPAGVSAAMGYNFNDYVPNLMHCEYTWIGSKGELRASFCSYSPDDTFSNPACSDIH